MSDTRFLLLSSATVTLSSLHPTHQDAEWEDSQPRGPQREQGAHVHTRRAWGDLSPRSRRKRSTQPVFTLDLAPEPVILPPLGSQRPTPHIPLTPASIPSLHFHDKQKINQPLFCQFGFHTPLPLYLKTKFPIFALISQPTFKHNNNKLLQGREEGMSQDWGLAHSPCLSGSDWVRGWRHGRGGRPRSRTSPDSSPPSSPLLMTFVPSSQEPQRSLGCSWGPLQLTPQAGQTTASSLEFYNLPHPTTHSHTHTILPKGVI